MEKYDLTVIGGGPIGLKVAEIISKEDRNVLIVERRNEIGYPNHCSGLVSPSFVKENSVPESIIVNSIKGAEFRIGNARLNFKDTIAHAVVINREAFDKNLAKNAVKNGATLLLGTTVTSFYRKNGDVILTLSNGNKVETHLVIIASGALTGINRMFGFENKLSETIHTIQFDGKVEGIDREIVYTFFDSNISHNWFSWVIPLNNERAHIGIGTDKNENLVYLMKKFISETPLLKNVAFDAKNAVSWVIPIGLFGEIVKDNVMIVGDAAAQVKPFSGGGLHTGMVSAKLAAKTALKALNAKNYSKSVLREYENELNKKNVPIIRRGLVLRKIYRSMSDRDKELFIRSLNNEEAKSIILKYGNIDSPTDVGIRLLKFVKGPLFLYFKELAAGAIRG